MTTTLHLDGIKAKQQFRVLGRRVPPAPGLRAPVEWGSEPRLRELFGDRVADLTVTPRDFVFRFESAEAFVDYFREHYGPTLKAFEALATTASCCTATSSSWSSATTRPPTARSASRPRTSR